VRSEKMTEGVLPFGKDLGWEYSTGHPYLGIVKLSVLQGFRNLAGMGM